MAKTEKSKERQEQPAPADTNNAQVNTEQAPKSESIKEAQEATATECQLPHPHGGSPKMKAGGIPAKESIEDFTWAEGA